MIWLPGPIKTGTHGTGAPGGSHNLAGKDARTPNSLLISVFCIAVIFLMAAAGHTEAQTPSAPVITWHDLAPRLERQKIVETGDDAHAGQSFASGPQADLPPGDPFDPLASDGLAFEDWDDAAFEVASDRLNSRVSIDGYVLPLRRENGRVIEFLLVPWVGACIHTPAPPPNQIIHVDYPEGFEAVSMFTPVRLAGRLTHWPASHTLFLVDGSRSIPTSYTMEQATIGGTPGEVIAANSAVEDRSWLGRAQARITDIFTTAMTDMEQGRSAGAVGLALLIAFAYGALHTLGPGHGKAVVVSYFIGTGGSLSRGVVMGVRIAVMHVLSAVVVVFLLDFAVRQATGAAPSDYRLIRLGSYTLIVAIGAVMLWHALADMRANEAGGHAHDDHDDGHAHAGCAACAAAQAKPQGGGWVAAAVGMVPCTGALIVMLFGLANDLVVPAVMMVVSISAGMALAMSAIGVAAILGRNWAEARLTTTPQRRHRFEAGARIAAAACVLAIGATLFTSTLATQAGTDGRRQASVDEKTDIALKEAALTTVEGQ